MNLGGALVWYDIDNPECLMDNDTLEDSIVNESEKRLFILEGKSGCGKTSFIKNLNSKKILRIPANLLSETIFYPGDLSCKRLNDDVIVYFLSQINLDYLIIEDIDYTIGRGDSIQLLFAEIVFSLINQYKVIITGIEISRICKVFLSTFPNQYRFYEFTDQKESEE